jgi:carboxypeptidase family protein
MEGVANLMKTRRARQPVMRKLLIHTTLASLVCVISLGRFPEAQFAHSNEPQDSTRVLTGRVFGRQNKPLEKAIVYLKNTKSLVIKPYVTDSDGSFRFNDLAPNVDYEVYAEYKGARSDTKTLSGFDSRKQANITLRVK